MCWVCPSVIVLHWGWLQLWSKPGSPAHWDLCSLSSPSRASGECLNQSQLPHACPLASTPELVTVWSGPALEVPRFCLTVAAVRSHIWKLEGRWRELEGPRALFLSILQTRCLFFPSPFLSLRAEVKAALLSAFGGLFWRIINRSFSRRSQECSHPVTGEECSP